MLRKMPIVLLFIAGVLVSACSSNKFVSLAQSGMKKTFWLTGAWNQERANTVEEWKYISKNVMTGKMYSAVQGDTIVAETYKLERKGKEIFLIMKSTESAIPQVDMKLKSETANSLVFENPQQEFPRTITITRDGMTKRTVFEGVNKEGEGITREFSFTKSQPVVKK